MCDIEVNDDGKSKAHSVQVVRPVIVENGDFLPVFTAEPVYALFVGEGIGNVAKIFNAN